MVSRTFEIISDSQENIRIDHFLSTKLTDLSRSKIKEAILNGSLILNDRVVNNPSAKKQQGVYRLELRDLYQSELTPKSIALDIVFEDEDLIVLNKAPGLTVHPGAGNYEDTLVNALLYHFGSNLSSVNGKDKPGIVHRLDRDTSGLMVVAKNDFTHMKLSDQLQDRTLARQYYALCYGAPVAQAGRIETYMDRSRADRTKMKVTKNTGRLAITDYEVIDSYADGAISLIRCKLHTGRTHQIRVHLTHIGHPIVGDHVYGKKPWSLEKKLSPQTISAINALNRQALHSFYIEFIHPRTEQKVNFAIQMHEDLLRIIEEYAPVIQKRFLPPSL